MTAETSKAVELLEGLSGKRVLVTGGTGSFGSTFVKLCLADHRVESVTVLSRDEQKHVALRRRFADPRLRSVVGDVRDLERLRFAMRGVDVVFNAAAIKHVHLTESHPLEAVKTNIIGAGNVCQAALEAGVEVLVTLSTDKAVEPVNVMGMSKAIQERLVGSFSGQGMRVGMIRYGNVLASNGSVVPFFKQLIEQGSRSLPVTDRRMTRFVLTLGESVKLVLHALRHCVKGETFVLDLPAFSIWDVAEVMARAASTSNREILVDEVGIRPGEKLHETLISSEEMRRAHRNDDLWIIERYHSEEELFRPSAEETCLTSGTARLLSQEEIQRLLMEQGCLPASRPAE